MLAPWRARQEVTAKKILAEGQASTLQIVAKAQSEAREILVSPDSITHGELDITETVSQRIQFQEEKRQRNIETIIRETALELGDKDVPDSAADPDWTARFFNDIQDVSSEEMQLLWARVLAGEIERSGSTSIKTLSILRNLDQTTAGIFSKLRSACVSVTIDDTWVIDARVPSLGRDAGNNALEKYGLGFGNLNVLNEHGLIISDYNSWRCYGQSIIEVATPEPKSVQNVLHLPFNFQGRYWILEETSARPIGKEFRLSGVALTRSGQELLRIVDIEPMSEYTQDLMQFFKSRELQMIDVGKFSKV